MGWTPYLIGSLVFINGMILTGIGVYALRNRPDPMAWPLALLTFAGASWAFPQAISFLYANESATVVLYALAVPGQNLIPLAYFILALRYAGYDEWLSRRVLVALSIFPSVTIVSAWSSQYNDLLWRETGVEMLYGVMVFAPEFGPWYWLNLSYVYILILVSLGVFASVVIRSGPIYRKQALLMLLGGLAPTVINILFTVGPDSLLRFDLTTVTLTVSGLTFAAALFRYDVLNLSPAAYRNVSEIFGDGVLIFDDGGILLESNARAGEILDVTLAAGMDAEAIFDGGLGEVDGTVLSAANGREFYMARCSPLQGHKDRVVGHVVVIRNITELKEHEQRLSVTNRVLRHNLRTELNIIYGYAETLDEKVANGYNEIDQIQDAAGRLEAVGENARHIQSWMDRTESSLRPADATAVLEQVVSRYREQYPAATISLQLSGRLEVAVHDPEQLETVFANVIENAIKHNDRAEPVVEIATEQTAETITFRFADDGPGIPPEERTILSRAQETKLEHGSSLGLWVINWLTTAVGGTVEFAENDPRGTVVVIRLQRPA